jgi:hypothetical protein
MLVGLAKSMLAMPGWPEQFHFAPQMAEGLRVPTMNDPA